MSSIAAPTTVIPKPTPAASTPAQRASVTQNTTPSSQPANPSANHADGFSRATSNQSRQLASSASRPAPLAPRPSASRSTEKVIVTTQPTGQPTSSQFDTSGKTRITTTNNSNYNPQTTTRTVVPRDRILFDYLRSTDAGCTENYENTDRALLRGQIQTYAQSNPQVLRRLGIPSANHLDRLSPSQAIQLSSQMAQDMVRYDHASIVKDSSDNYTADALTRQNSADARPVNDYFGTSHDGTCRNYAEVVQASFAELKAMQNPSTTQLANSYVTMPVSHNHTWNSLYTVEPDGDVMVTQVDATWNETNRAGTSRGTDFTYGQNGVRDYYRMQHLLEGTGNRPLESFSNIFDNGESWSDIANSGSISATEVGAAGGYSALSAAIDTLPEPLRVDAYNRLNSDVKVALNTWRSSNNRPALATSHPQHN